MLSDDLFIEGWDGLRQLGERLKGEKIYVCLQLIHVVQQKLITL